MASSTWEFVEARLLATVEEHEGDDGVESLEKLIVLSGLDPPTAKRSVRKLVEAGYLTGLDASSDDGFDLCDIRLTERGSRETGQWPRGDEAGAAFVKAIELAIANAPPEKRRSSPACSKLLEKLASAHSGTCSLRFLADRRPSRWPTVTILDGAGAIRAVLALPAAEAASIVAWS